MGNIDRVIGDLVVARVRCALSSHIGHWASALALGADSKSWVEVTATLTLVGAFHRILLVLSMVTPRPFLLLVTLATHYPIDKLHTVQLTHDDLCHSLHAKRKHVHDKDTKPLNKVETEI